MALDQMQMLRMAMQAAQTAPVPQELLEFTGAVPGGGPMAAAPPGIVPQNQPAGVPFTPPTQMTANVPQGMPTPGQAIPPQAGGFYMPGQDMGQLQALMAMLGGEQQMPGALPPQQLASQGGARGFGQDKQLDSSAMQQQQPEDKVQSLMALLSAGGLR